MMKKSGRKIDAGLKAKIALEAIGEQSTVADLAQRTGSIGTRSTPGRSSFRSKRHGRLTLVLGGTPRNSGSGRSRSCTRRLGSSLSNAIFSQEVRQMSAPDCESAWNKDPVFGVIGIQSGPPGRRVPSGFRWGYGGQGGDAGSGDDRG